MHKNMLVVVDYQNDFVDGALGFPGAEKLDRAIAEKIRHAEQNGTTVVVTMDTHGENYLDTREGQRLPVPHCIEGSRGWELFGETGEVLGRVGHVTLCKATFGAAPLDLAKLPEGVEEIELVGLVSNMCLISNVCCFQATYPQAQITVDMNLCDSFDKDLHKKTAAVLRGMQVDVLHAPWLDGGE